MALISDWLVQIISTCPKANPGLASKLLTSEVMYTSEGWLDRNNDAVSEEGPKEIWLPVNVAFSFSRCVLKKKIFQDPSVRFHVSGQEGMGLSVVQDLVFLMRSSGNELLASLFQEDSKGKRDTVP